MFCEKCGKYVQGDHCPDCDTVMAQYATEETAKRKEMYRENLRIGTIRPFVLIALLLSLAVSIMAFFPVLEWKVWGNIYDTVSIFSTNSMTTILSLAGIFLPPIFLGCYNASGDVRNGWMLTVSVIAEAVLPCCAIAAKLECSKEKVEGPRYTITDVCTVWMIFACICVILILIAKVRAKPKIKYIKNNPLDRV